MTLATYKFDGHEDETIYYLNELNKELNRQFYKDGTNFEGSSHYSAFVTEALIIFKLSLDELQPDSPLLELIQQKVSANRNLLNFYLKILFVESILVVVNQAEFHLMKV